MKFYYFLKNIGFFIHFVISRSKVATKLYLCLVSFICGHSILSLLIDRKRLFSSMNSVQWHDVSLNAQNIILGNNTKVKIIPHFNEFDFESVFSPMMSYESEVFSYLEPHIVNYDAIVEIGANVGIYSLFFSRLFFQNKKKGKIFAFEPSRKAYHRLLDNIKINSANNIYPFNLAVGQNVDFMDFFEPEGHLTNGSFCQDFAKIFSSSITVNKTFVIDGSILKKLVEDCGNLLIKIDVEGYEYEVLQTLETFISLKKPEIMLEVLSIYQDKLNNLNFLFEKNYSFFNITDKGLVRYEKLEATEFRNYILLPVA